MNPARFTDFDEYANAIGNVDVDVRLLHLHERHWSLQKITLESLQLQHAQEGSGFLAHGQMNRAGWGLYILESAKTVPVNGKQIGPGTLAVLPPGAEFCFSGRGTVKWYSVFIPESLLERELEAISVGSSVRVCNVRHDVSKRLLSQLRSCFQCAAKLESASPRSPGFASIQEDLLTMLRGILVSSDPTDVAVSNLDARRRLVSRAVELVHDCPEEMFSVRSLAETLVVSERSLLYAFRDHLGVNPQSFLINHRLHQARQELKRGDVEQLRVSTVAAKYGFLDFGRFAGKYCQLFGEHPSVTLRQSRPTQPPMTTQRRRKA